MNSDVCHTLYHKFSNMSLFVLFKLKFINYFIKIRIYSFSMVLLDFFMFSVGTNFTEIYLVLTDLRQASRCNLFYMHFLCAENSLESHSLFCVLTVARIF